MIGSVDFLASVYNISLEPQHTAAARSADFATWMQKEMDGINRQILDAEQQARSLAAGNVENLHEVMIALEEARISFQLMAQTRNRLLEAYQEILRMQV